MTQFTPSPSNDAAVLHGGPYPAKRLVRWFSQVYKGSGAHINPDDCRDAPRGSILSKARAV